MKIATAYSREQNPSTAVAQISESLSSSISEPKLLIAYYTQGYAPDELRQALTVSYPHAQILGCSTCQGVMTQAGYIEGECVAVWAASDGSGAYGTAVSVNCTKSEDEQARLLLTKAIEKSERQGELPKLIALHATPGEEETILEAIYNELGVAVPIIGGSAADNSVSGEWSIFDNDNVSYEGIGVIVFYPSARVSYSFHSGYASTGIDAIATKAEGRELLELNDQPAAEIYRQWLEQETGRPPLDGSVFEQATLYPLGREIGTIHGLPYYTLSHPVSYTDRGGIVLFSKIDEGDRVFLMSGTTEMLISRAGRVIESANEHALHGPHPVGGLAIYCAGCMLHVKNKLHEVADNINYSLYHAPFVCPFTFGEQGLFMGGELSHGNLMISAVLFHKD